MWEGCHLGLGSLGLGGVKHTTNISLIKVDMPKSNTTTMWTPAFEWYVVRCGSKNMCQKEACLKEIDQGGGLFMSSTN